jgi:cytochrome c oxidase subunit 2
VTARGCACAPKVPTISNYGFASSRRTHSDDLVGQFRRKLRWATATAAIVLAAAGCLPQPATAEGRDVASLYTGFVAIAAVIGAIVFGVTTWSVLRYRRRHDEPTTSLPPQTRGNVLLESIWTGLPIVTVLILFAATLVVLNRVEAKSDRPAAVIRVEAFRWGWLFSYPNESVTVAGASTTGPEIVVPVGQPIQVTLTAADVVHAFYVPQFLFKRDAVPGRESTFQFTVDAEGTYRGQCAEFCGIYHSRMPFTIRAVSRETYDAWLASQPKSSPAAP